MVEVHVNPKQFAAIVSTLVPQHVQARLADSSEDVTLPEDGLRRLQLNKVVFVESVDI